MKRKCIIKALSLLLCIVTSQEVCAQWAGPDQEILRNENNTQTVALSVLIVDPDACYEWSGPNIQSDSMQPSIVANPQNETQTYTCTKTGRYGVEQDAVVVKVYDSVEFVSVRPLKHCYKPGEVVSESDFEIITHPKHYRQYVTVSPRKIRDYGLFWDHGSGKQPIDLTFSLVANNRTMEKTVTVYAINEDIELSFSTDNEILKLKQKFELFQQCSGIIERAAKRATSTKKFPGMRPKSSPFDIGWSSPSFSYSHKCCNDNIVGVLGVSWDGGHVDYTLEKYAPLFWFGPGNIYVSVEANFYLSIGHVGLQLAWADSGCSGFDYSLAFNVGCSIAGNVGVSLLNPRILSLQVGLKGAGSGTGYWNIPNTTFKWDPVIIKASLVGRITFLSLTVLDGEYVFAEWIL